MKTRAIRTIVVQLVLFLLFTNVTFAQPQGKVVINEYMPWTSNSCGVTSEFVELMNFGPGPVDIGCYILTTGVYSVTIPPNTILRPGDFYIIGGQDFIPGTCANVDSTATGVTVNLNWNKCNCTNVPIPQTGSGMMTDGGGANTPIVLFDPNLNVIDAIVRSIPFEATKTITTSSANGSCASRTFNLGSMNISYETLGMAPGQQNSFARSLDGDCNWLKQPNQSGNATNNRKGNTTDISYDFDMVSPTSCEEKVYGSVSIYVKHSDYSKVFPMSYTISLDVNNNGTYDFTDKYETYTDYDPPFIEIDSLPVGRFRVTVYSVKGCYLKSYDFSIIPCEPNTLPVRLLYFKNGGSRQNQHQLEWLLQDVQHLQSIVLEKGREGEKFVTEKVFTNERSRGDKLYSYPVEASPTYPHYRLKITQKNGRSFYSPVINTASGSTPQAVRIGPNPATDKLNLQVSSTTSQKVAYTIYNSSGLAVQRGNLLLNSGENTTTIPVHSILPGTYHLRITGLSANEQPISFRFVKH